MQRATEGIKGWGTKKGISLGHGEAGQVEERRSAVRQQRDWDAGGGCNGAGAGGQRQGKLASCCVRGTRSSGRREDLPLRSSPGSLGAVSTLQ